MRNKRPVRRQEKKPSRDTGSFDAALYEAEMELEHREILKALRFDASYPDDCFDDQTYWERQCAPEACTVCAHEFELLRQQYENGNKGALWGVIAVSAMHGSVLPNWARKAIVRAYVELVLGTSPDWNSIFGSFGTKGRTAQRRVAQKWAPLVYKLMSEAVAQGDKVTTETFGALVARHKLPISASAAKKLYFAWRKAKTVP